MKAKFDLIIFDWDGTVMDSTDRIVSCFQNAAQDCNEPIPTRAAIESSIGLSLDEAWRSTVPGLSDKQVMAMTEAYKTQFITTNQTAMPLFEGALEGLKQLASAGQWMAIATGKSRRGMQRVFMECDVEHLFLTSRCGDETHSKPNPQMLFDVLEATGVEAANAVMVGDTRYDMQMAQQAGVASLAVSYGVNSRDELAELATLGVADSFAEVVQWFI